MNAASRRSQSLSTRLLMLLGVMTLLAACSGGSPLVKPGANTAGSRLVIDSEMEWTRFSGSRYQVWTMDGELLNRLYLIPAVREGEHVFLVTRQSRRRPDGAFFHPGARPDEIRDLIVDGLAAAGAVNIRTENLRPASFGQHEGVRFEVRLTNQEGLEYQAMAAAFEHDRTLALALFIATSEYYYPRDAAKVDRMLGTLRWR
ncbi:MAG: hypothetical protein IAE66_00355 [Xanthomonadaceae bacterium]|nr:hypothetical protein [Xanthomonadaceae bacterium]